MEDKKECPFCGEEIKTMAIICHFCHGDLNVTSKNNKGKFVRIRLKAGDKTYFGDVFLPEHFRVSDLINDDRHFIVLANAVEEKQTRDVPIGFLALNKNMAEWIELKTVEEEPSPDYPARRIYHSA